ncbi:MAG TPA: YceI family protein [Ohtaekwangia sp.]|nr:YceI family protein [Ohtaekwangia sp.]
MKKNVHLTLLSLVIFTATVFTACNQPPKGDDAVITDKQTASEGVGQSFKLDTAESHVRFTGHGVGKNHPGKFKITAGEVQVENNQITGGDFQIDIKSMDMEEDGPMIDSKLRPHLLSGDFFDADKFGAASFEITKIEPYEPNSQDTSIVDGANFSVSGNFKLKDITKNITFPARIDLDENKLEAKANFDIDRRDWQMNYGNDKTLGDKFISETVNIELDLTAKK